MDAAYSLVFYLGGTAVLTDSAGELLWSSTDDEEFIEEFDELVTIDDEDDVVEYLVDCGYLPEDSVLDVVESDAAGNDTGKHRSLDDDDEDDDDEDDDEPETMQ